MLFLQSVDTYRSAFPAVSRLLALSLLASAVVVTTGCGEAANAPGMEQPPANVSVITLQSSEVSLKEALPGRTTAYKVAEIRPQVNGIITQRLFTEGQVVKAGQQLYQIDDAVYQTELNRAKGELRRTEAAQQLSAARLKRYANLSKGQVVSQQDYEEAQAQDEEAAANIAIAKAAVSAAEINLAYTKVYAPIDGKIGISNITEGALVNANQASALARITQLDPIYVDMPLSSTDYLRLQSQLGSSDNLPVTLRLDATNQTYQQQGKLQFADVTVDQSTGAVQLRALFPNPEQTLLPGLFVRAELNVGGRQAILVPQQATSRNAQGELSVWRVTPDNTVEQVPVAVAEALNNQWIVTSGVNAGDVIVIQGFQKISEGATINPTPYADSVSVN